MNFRPNHAMSAFDQNMRLLEDRNRYLRFSIKDPVRLPDKECRGKHGVLP